MSYKANAIRILTRMIHRSSHRCCEKYTPFIQYSMFLLKRYIYCKTGFYTIVPPQKPRHPFTYNLKPMGSPKHAAVSKIHTQRSSDISVTETLHGNLRSPTGNDSFSQLLSLPFSIHVQKHSILGHTPPQRRQAYTTIKQVVMRNCRPWVVATPGTVEIARKSPETPVTCIMP